MRQLAILAAAWVTLWVPVGSAEPAPCLYRYDAIEVGGDHYALAYYGPGYDQAVAPPYALQNHTISWGGGYWSELWEETNEQPGLQTDARACWAGADRLVWMSYVGTAHPTIQF